MDIKNKIIYIVEKHTGSRSVFVNKIKFNILIKGDFKFEYNTRKNFYTTKKEALDKSKEFKKIGYNIYNKI